MSVIKKLYNIIKEKKGLTNDEFLIMTDMEERRQEEEARKETEEPKQRSKIDPRDLMEE